MICILYGEESCKRRQVYIGELQRQILKNKNLACHIKSVSHYVVQKFWLISVFITNAKGGDC